jgi:hypothetical protein
VPELLSLAEDIRGTPANWINHRGIEIGAPGHRLARINVTRINVARINVALINVALINVASSTVLCGAAVRSLDC